MLIDSRSSRQLKKKIEVHFMVQLDHIVITMLCSGGCSINEVMSVTGFILKKTWYYVLADICLRYLLIRRPVAFAVSQNIDFISNPSCRKMLHYTGFGYDFFIQRNQSPQHSPCLPPSGVLPQSRPALPTLPPPPPPPPPPPSILRPPPHSGHQPLILASLSPSWLLPKPTAR